MIPWLEEAGYGIVVYDYPFNRSIAESCDAFARDWAAFRDLAKTSSRGRSWRFDGCASGKVAGRR